jgi:hypothetical protein
MKQKLSRSERIPKYGTPLRSQLVTLVSSLPGYQEGLDKGFPLFTSEELKELKERYKDGFTWEEIDKILSGKGIFFKKATFRKYIQDGIIAKAFDYKNTTSGRVAIFPADTISHINFIQYYYKIIDGEHIDKIVEMIKGQEITYLDAIESNLNWKDNIYASIFSYICFNDGDTATAIKKVLKCRPSDRDMILKMLNKIDDKFQNIIRKDIDKLVTLLKSSYISVHETMDDDKEVKDEQN